MNKDILYIDDEKENLIGFKYVFKKHYNVHLASSAEEGWKILSKNFGRLPSNERAYQIFIKSPIPFTGVPNLENKVSKN